MVTNTTADYTVQKQGLGINTNTITLSAWVKPNGTQASFAGIITSSNGGAVNLNLRDNNQLGYHWNDTYWSFAGAPALPLDVWSHVALVVEPTQSTIYLNGVGYVSTGTHNAINFTQPFFVGIDRGNTSRSFKGNIDEVAMYSRALTQTEIRTLMHLTKNNPNAGNLPAVDASLLAYYQFNEASGSKTVYDKIANNHLTVVGAAQLAKSTAPVGGGTAALVNVTAGGAVNFGSTGVQLTFPATGTYPNGDVVATKLNVAPDSSVSSTGGLLPANPAGYFIVDNFGANKTISSLSSAQFSNINGITNLMTTNPQAVSVYKRTTNEGLTWSKIDSAETVTTNSVLFSTGYTDATLGHYIMAARYINPASPAGVADVVSGNMLTTTTNGDYAMQTSYHDITTNTLTLSAWVKPNGIQDSYSGIITSNNGGALNLNLMSNNQLGYHWANSSATFNWAGGPTVPANVWSHVAMVVEPTQTTLYLNGVPYVHANNNTALLLDQSFYFGSDRGQAARTFKGNMDEVCIYNRSLSAAEIRNLMHLTKNNPNAGSLPAVDNSLIGYYQFNSLNANGIAGATYNGGTVPAALFNGANISNASTAPVGAGTYDVINVVSGGTKIFTNTGVELSFPTTGTYPNGDVVVTKLNKSSQLVANTVLPSSPQALYVINNFGTNQTVSALSSIKFNSITGITSGMISYPNSVIIYKRSFNAEGSTWGAAIDSAETVSSNQLFFSTGLNNTDFGQYALGARAVVIPTAVADTVPGFVLTNTANGDYALMDSALNVTSNNFTISAWVKPNGVQDAYSGIVTSSNGGAVNLNLMSNNQLGYHWEDMPNSYSYVGGPTVPSGTWSHVALVVTPTNATLYLNGKAYVNTLAHNAISFNQPFYIGSDRGQLTRNFKGNIEEVAIYNKALTAAEIREHMHLTKNNPNVGSKPVVDNTLLAYYQFNKLIGGKVAASANFIPLSLVGAANITTASTAPVGGGTFDRVSVTSGGVKTFAATGVNLTFPTSGTFPNGDVVVTRIHVAPNAQPSTYMIPSVPKAYFIMRNFGTNATFTTISSAVFKNLYGFSSTTASNYKLYKRGANAEGATWGTSIKNASSISQVAGRGSVTFNTLTGITTDYQFSIGSTASVLTKDDVANSFALQTIEAYNVKPEISLSPNPSIDGWFNLKVKGVTQNQTLTLVVFDVAGKFVNTMQFDDISNHTSKYVNIGTKGAGTYVVQGIFSNGDKHTMRVVVK